MSKQNWWKVIVRCSDAEAQSALLFELGSRLTETVSEDTLACFIQGDALEFRQSVEALGMTVIESSQVEERNWHESCPELWQTVELGKLRIVPVEAIETAPKRGPQDLQIIPGLGFGTGHHAATAMLVDLLQSESPTTALDLGCGSGILAIALALLTSAKIDAIDNDELAIGNARDNVALNHVQDRIRLIVGSVDSAAQSYDLIVANLYTSLLIQFEAELAKRTRNLLVSGVQVSERAELLSAYAGRWRLVSERTQNGWWAGKFSLNSNS